MGAMQLGCDIMCGGWGECNEEKRSDCGNGILVSKGYIRTRVVVLVIRAIRLAENVIYTACL